ncbi:hypothetical protein [Kordia zhangzhouensis]|uniref:hypothetical protein n=1 Tax=Kordia zhangzhouensis TaxID=1620405 RepID=UPI00062906A8|nr:hypothetical protein [Kordia zhangzhouensis]
MKYICWIFFLGMTLPITAQNSYKHEKEERIEAKMFPKKALELLQHTLPEKTKKVKYYKEQDSLKISYEIKLKFKGDSFSIEFDKDGTLEDVEVIIKKREISTETYDKIKSYLNNQYDSFRIKKIQRQYRNTSQIADKKVIEDAFQEHIGNPFLYEIIAEVKKAKKRYFIEITFSKHGDFQLVRTIIGSSYDHILY